MASRRRQTKVPRLRGHFARLNSRCARDDNSDCRGNLERFDFKRSSILTTRYFSKNEETLRFAQDDNQKLFVVVQEREDVVAFEFFAAVEKIEFDDERKAGDFAA